MHSALVSATKKYTVDDRTIKKSTYTVAGVESDLLAQVMHACCATSEPQVRQICTVGRKRCCLTQVFGSAMQFCRKCSPPWHIVVPKMRLSAIFQHGIVQLLPHPPMSVSVCDK